jgi:hypothetical protein
MEDFPRSLPSILIDLSTLIAGTTSGNSAATELR